MSVRLRQAVIAAAELAPVADKLRDELGLGEPFADPGVGFFGLHNAVFALGDQFLEVIAPQQADTAVDRWLARHGGDGGYMLIFQVDDIAGARAARRRSGSAACGASTSTTSARRTCIRATCAGRSSRSTSPTHRGR